MHTRMSNGPLRVLPRHSMELEPQIKFSEYGSGLAEKSEYIV